MGYLFIASEICFENMIQSLRLENTLKEFRIKNSYFYIEIMILYIAALILRWFWGQMLLREILKIVVQFDEFWCIFRSGFVLKRF